MVRRHGPASVGAGRRGVRGQIFRHRSAYRTHRLRAAFPGLAQESAQHPRRRHHQRVRRRALHRLETERLARAVPAGGGREILPGGTSAILTASTPLHACGSLGYNTNLVRSDEAPKSFADLLDPKWGGKIVKAHPGYSGTIMTATYQIARELGWEYFERLARQKVMQVQSSVDPPKKLAAGERAVMADGNDFTLIQLKEQGQPVETVYPIEGSPLSYVPTRSEGGAKSECRAPVAELSAVSRGRPGAVRLRRAAVGRIPRSPPSRGGASLQDIKVMNDDPAAVRRGKPSRSRNAMSRSSRYDRPALIACGSWLPYLPERC